MNGFGMGAGMWIFWIVVIALVVFVMKIMMNENSSQANKSEKSPMEILEKRYASGEITQDEFESIKNELEKEN